MARKDYMDKMLQDSIDKSIIDYIDKSVKSLNDDTDMALAIYIKLAQLFWYSPSFVYENDYSVVQDLSQISVENNDVICLHFSIIYSKLLSMYGIKNSLLGNDEHLLVKVMTDKFVMFADATRYGAERNEYMLSDLTNLKLSLKLSGIYVLGEENSRRLIEEIDKVCDMLGIELYTTRRLDELLKKFRTYTMRRMQKCKIDGEVVITRDEILRRIKFLNYFYHLKVKLHEVERLQFFSKYYRNIFEGFEFDTCRCITLGETNDDVSHLIRLLILADDFGEIYYFLENDNGFIEYTKDELLNQFDKRNICFKYEVFNVLGFSNSEIDNYSKKKSSRK